MSDSLEPPAKRARLEADAPFFGASATAQDAPGSPVDDLDDDFYDTTPVKSLSHAAAHDQAAVFAAAASAPSGFHLPGLGSVSETPAAPQPQTAAHSSSTVAHAQRDDASEDGELSDDDDAFYNDESAFDGPAANQAPGHVEAPHQDGDQSRSDAHSEFTSTTRDAAAADTPAVDTDGELDAALAAAIDEQNDAQDAADDLAIANAHAAGFDSKAEFLAAAEANRDDKNAEWQLDSDASDSNSDSSSSSSDDSSDEDGSDEGELLDPEEQIRLLMAEVADESGATKAKVKTLNEQDEQYEKPDITVTDATKITELGKVESVVENLVVIKAKVSGDFQVLESGSALCLQNRTVIGKVSEQIGRVEDPRYSVGFNDLAEIETLGIAKDTPIYYVNEHSTFVETEPLRRQKHTDASNLHDEETNDVEFSDDEKEAEYKREQKAKKRARTEDNEDRPKLPIPTGPRGHVDAPMRYQSTEYQGGGLKYSDDEDDDDMGMYKPLARPDHFEQIVGHGAPLEDRSHVRRGMGRGRGPWGDRGRGMRGRGGFGGRGDFGGGQANRGNFGQGRGDFGGGRGDRGGHRGDRGGHGNNRGDKGGDRGGRGGKQQNDRGRHQEQFHEQQHNQQKNGPQHGGRSATSASPARQQQDRGQSQSRQNQGQSQMQQSPAAGGGKNKNRKQRQREKRERERQQQQQNHQQNQQKQQASPAPSGPSNTNAYAGNSGANWPVPFSNPAQPAQAYAAAADPPPPSAAAAPVAPPFPQAAYGGQAPATGQAQQQQGSWEAWAQWFQVVGAMSQQAQPQQQHQQPQAYAPAPPQPAPQPQAQYPYQYQQFAQQQPVAPPQPQQQAQGQAGQPTLQDILRALGQQGAAPR